MYYFGQKMRLALRSMTFQTLCIFSGKVIGPKNSKVSHKKEQIELSKDYLKQDDWYPRRNKFGGGDYFARPYTSSRSINGHKKSDSRCKWGLLRHHCWRWWSLSQWAVKVWKKLKYISKYFFKNETRYGCRTYLPPEGLKLMIF